MEISDSRSGQNYIVTDLGTTHIKSAVFDRHGHLLEMRKAPAPDSRDDCGNVYDPLSIYEAVGGQIVCLLQRFNDIKGISITGMSEAGLIINRKKMTEETPILPWFDRRTVTLSRQSDDEAEAGNFYRTGLRNSYKYGIYKYLWLLDRYRLPKEDTVWLSACDYIVWKLTGSFATDPSFAARTYVYDIFRHCWDEERLAAYGLTADNFPEVIPSGEAAGYLSDSRILSAVRTDPVPVCIGGHDHVCAAYAVLDDDPGRICDSMGTAETYLGIDPADNFILTKEHYESGMVYGPFVNGRDYFWMANIPSSGQSVEWFRKQVQKTEITYTDMNELLSALPEGPTDILYYPYLSGIGTPFFRSDIGGGFLGLKASHGAADLLKAILEGICYQGRWILSLVPGKRPETVKDIVCVGGAANSLPWMKLKADISGIPVTVPEESEATLLGAAAVMIEKLCTTQERKIFLAQARKQNRIFPVNRTINEQYNEIYAKKYTFLIDLLMKQELGRKE